MTFKVKQKKVGTSRMAKLWYQHIDLAQKSGWTPLSWKEFKELNK